MSCAMAPPVLLTLTVKVTSSPRDGVALEGLILIDRLGSTISTLTVSDNSGLRFALEVT